ncbi:hypothetical protein RI367_000662 [Sorochytrium milnesiophthora]
MLPPNLVATQNPYVQPYELMRRLHGGDYYEFAIQSVPDADRLACYKSFLPADFAHDDLRDVKLKRVRLNALLPTDYDRHDPLLLCVRGDLALPGDLVLRSSSSSRRRPQSASSSRRSSMHEGHDHSSPATSDAEPDADVDEQDLPSLPVYTGHLAPLVGSPPGYMSPLTVEGSSMHRGAGSSSSSKHGKPGKHGKHAHEPANPLTEGHLADMRICVEEKHDSASNKTTTTYHVHYVTAPDSVLDGNSDAFDKFVRNVLAYISSQRSFLASLRDRVALLPASRRRRSVRVCVYVGEDNVSHRLAMKRMGVAGEAGSKVDASGQVVYTFKPRQIDALTAYGAHLEGASSSSSSSSSCTGTADHDCAAR